MSGTEVWLYGSRARGDADALSDTDVLVVADSSSHLESIVSGLPYPRVSASFYSWDEVERMREYGSLYLHHIALEGRRLIASNRAPSRFPALLRNLPAFQRAREDLCGFRRALAESRESLADGGWPDFECEVVATVARHAAIAASWCVGEPAFGRERPFWIAGRALGYSDAEIGSLIGPSTAWRLHQPGAHTHPGAMARWLNQVEHFLDGLQGVIDDYTRVLPAAA